MTMADTERLSFENILNLRDVGSTINKFTGQKLMKEGLLWRSARPDNATPADRKRLKEECHIKTIIDLRTKSEHIKQAQAREKELKLIENLKSNDSAAEPLKIPAIDYLEININGKGFERSLLWKLKYWSLIKLIFLMAIGHRIEAISILGREVMLPRGLIGLGFDSIDYCGKEIAEAMRVYASPDRYPIMCHCTQGKDRTGLLIALLLFLLDVPIDAITCDYTKSEFELESEKATRMVEIKEIGLSEEFATTPEEWIPQMKSHLDEKYGGVRKYLMGIGIDEDEQRKIVETLKS